jgi:multidrug efflux pump
MNITNLAIKKSLTIFVLIFLIIFVGFMSYVSMPRESAPDIEIPYIIVKTIYFGVSPSDMETLITNPLEKKLKKLKNVEEIMSTSGDSFSSISIEFKTDVDIEDALRRVKEKVDEAKPDLPADAEDPEVIEINLSEIPIMIINVSGEYGLVKLKEVAELLKDRIETVKGVLDVILSGGLEREIQVIVDKEKLKKYGLSLNQISSVVSAENINIPGGNIDIGNAKYLIRIPGEFEEINEINNIIVDAPDGKPIYIRDIATVKDAFKEKETYSRLNNKESVSLSVQKRSGQNIIHIAQKVKKILQEEKNAMPTTTEISIIADQSDDISGLVDELENSIILGLLLVVLVLYMFMGKRNAFFVGVAIPLSMLVTFSVLHLMNITLNMVLLFGLILSLGMLVDNAIVIVENIYRFVEEGMDKVEAAKKATAEVAWPVIASTATTIAVFVPLLYIPGIPGKFMKFLPISVITTISASLFVAMIINPVICANYMSGKKERIKNKKTDKGRYERFQKSYKAVLEWSLNNRRKVLLSSISIFFATIFLFKVTNPGFEFFPDITPSQIYMRITTSADSNVDYTNSTVRDIENKILSHKNISKIITTIGSNQGNIFSAGNTQSNIGMIIVEFKEGKERIENPYDTIAWIRKQIKSIPGAEIEIEKEAMGPPSGSPIGIKIAGKNYKKLSEYSIQIKKIMEKVGGIVDIKDDYIKGKPEIIIKINKEKAALLEVNTSLIASTIRTAIYGSKISVYREEDEEYDITLMLPKNKKDGIKILEELYIAGPEGVQIPLIELAEIYTSIGMGSIQHLDSERVITVTASPEEGYLADERLKTLAQELNTFEVASGYKFSFVGESKHKDIMSNYLKKAFIIALFLIAIILVTQFNSLLLPIIIMCSVFLSIIGVLLGLIIFHRPFGIVMTGIGTISLAGVIVNNAIVLIEYIQQLRESGKDKMTAVIEAGVIRLRPVILTAVTTILGLVPMTFGINFNFKNFYNNLMSINPISNLFESIELGSQSTEFWGSMGSSVTIGLAVGTILTLIVVPVLYISLDNLKEKILLRNSVQKRRYK